MFLTLEGPEGAGKTTQGRLLAEHLTRAGHDVLHVREPGGTLIGERLRALLLDPRHREMDARTEMLLFAASRAQLVAEVIIPALRQEVLVLCDRYVDASLAYQGVGRGLESRLCGPSTPSRPGDSSLTSPSCWTSTRRPECAVRGRCRRGVSAEKTGREIGSSRKTWTFTRGCERGFSPSPGMSPRGSGSSMLMGRSPLCSRRSAGPSTSFCGTGGRGRLRRDPSCS